LGWAKPVEVSVGEELIEERRRRGAGAPRLTDAGREYLARLVEGDLIEQFQAAFDAVSAADPLLDGTED
jgi:molybdenum-dependent DNA-binding transcriptional regulator ModE